MFSYILFILYLKKNKNRSPKKVVSYHGKYMPGLSNKLLSKLEAVSGGSFGGERLEFCDAIELLSSDQLVLIGSFADKLTACKCSEMYCYDLPDASKNSLIRTYNVERNINYTNICVSGCSFCAFCRSEFSPDAYLLSDEVLFAKISETVSLGGKQILLQGGLHPSIPFEWYESMLQKIKQKFPDVNIHGFSPTEIVFFSDKYCLTVEEVLCRLRQAGLGSLPGGGAEILVDRVRRELSPLKASADRWLEVCRAWHKIGGRGSATMMFGHIETLEERVMHLARLRELQDETEGFTAFIPWTFQPNNTKLKHIKKTSSYEYLKMLAVSRLFLDNFQTIQSSWVTQGLRIGTLGLSFGANDLGSIMIEENVVAAAGTSFRTNETEFKQSIKNAGYEPKRRSDVHCQPSTANLRLTK
ncbi:MAG: dehypoxanthine futalosine cyclase [Planctomycetaceae bacterium]|jgi:cyclic dehypoxanthinyl futalosine synthase|nr:dehypoxanthine futalosine cyclase [Planctomycetaceae bacterium]